MSTPENLKEVKQSSLELKIRKYALAFRDNERIYHIWFFPNKYAVFIYATMCSIQSCYKALRNNSWDARISDGGGCVRNAV